MVERGEHEDDAAGDSEPDDDHDYDSSPADDSEYDEARDDGADDNQVDEDHDDDSSADDDQADGAHDDDDSSADDGSPDDGDSKSVDVSEITAPSIGPNTKIEKESPQERMARGDQSTTDAMGLDKHREVIGGRYSASPLRQATIYGIVVAVVIAVGFGLKTLAGELDQPPKEVADEAPWSDENAPQRPPVPLQ